MDEEETRGDKRGGAKEPLRGQEAVLISMPMAKSARLGLSKTDFAALATNVNDRGLYDEQ